MKRSRCWTAVAAVGFVAAFLFLLPLGCDDGSATGEARPADQYWSPWVTKTGPRSATINWRGQSRGFCYLAYGRTSYYQQHLRFEKMMRFEIAFPFQHIPLAGLEPNTSYTYRVMPVEKPYVYGDRSFRTMPESGPFTFVVVSDTQEGHRYTEYKRFRYVAEAIAKEPDVLFILHGGDNAGFDEDSDWTTYFQVAEGMLADISIFPAIGNHEYHHFDESSGPPTDAVNYRRAYDVPLTYSFACAGVRFIVLNTPDPAHANEDDPHTSKELALSQAGWLEEQLKAPALGTFVIHHHPIWDEGRTDINRDLESWEDLFHAYPISANFAGHTHDYQRYDIDGIPYFVVGNGGGMCSDNQGPFAAGYVFGETRKLGYLRVFVDPVNNTATAEEIFVASLKKDDSDETPVVFDPPIVADRVTFRLREN
ncbi:MAG: metallophosphoesterase [Thermodesulfobacteriota bacterium]